MSSREFSEWLAYSQTSPIDPQWRADLRMARVASLIANGHRDEKRKPDPFTVDDFMPRFAPDEAGEAGMVDEAGAVDEETVRRDAQERARALFAKVHERHRERPIGVGG